MEHPEKALSAAAIKYLLTIAELCGKRPGARCVDIAGRMGVSKPGAHSMIRNLCEAGLAERNDTAPFPSPMPEEKRRSCTLPAIVRCAAGCRKRWGWRKRPAGMRPAPSLRRNRNGSQSLPCA